jgi:hypothetical protein
VQEYVLIDPAIPPVSEGWPDARVSVYSDDDQSMARLRGWRVESSGGLAGWEPADL